MSADMNGFTKLHSSIVASTIWRSPDNVRLVWITMLAMADQHGEVAASIPGLAAMANVTVEACEAALEALSSPDKYSRTPDHEGRRIEACEGGWRLLNHAKYRHLAGSEDRLAKDAERKRRQRAAAKDASADVRKRPQASAMSRQAEAEAETESNTEASRRQKAEQPPPRPDVSDLAWLARTAEEITRGQIEPSALLRQGSKRRAAAESVLAAIEKAAKVRGLPMRELAEMALDEWLDERRARLADWIGLFADDLGATLIRLDDRERDRQAREGEAAQ